MFHRFSVSTFGHRPWRFFWPIILTLGVYWLALIYQLGAQWSIYDQYSYGWSVPFLCAFLLWQRITGGTTPGRLKTETLTGPVAAVGISKFQVSGFWFLLIVLALLYAPTRFLHEANPIWRLTSWLWAVEVVGITLCVIWLMPGKNAETLKTERLKCDQAEGSGQRSAVGGQKSEAMGQGLVASRSPRSALRFSDFIFPVCFFLVAVPWPSGLEALMVQSLTRLNVAANVEVLGWLGIPALQHGNVIEVATGEVGVNEACSGIRSFQATLMMALFFGEFYRLNVRWRAGLCLAGFALSSLFNLGRTTLLTWVVARKGSAAMAAWHDPAGVTILVGCFLSLWGTAVWLHGAKPKTESGKQDGGSENGGAVNAETLAAEDGQPGTAGNRRPAIARRIAIALLAWFVLVEAGTQVWFWRHENTAAAQSAWSVAVGENSELRRVDIPTEISGQFQADEAVEARGPDDRGNYWQVYFFRWFPSHSLSRRVAVQLAKTHGPEKCLPAAGMTMKSDLGVVTVPVGRRQFALHQYVFLANGQSLHVFYGIYENQTGSTVLTSRRQDTRSRVAAALAGSRNVGQQFLELAVTGPDSPEAARADLIAELNQLVVGN